MLTLRSQADGLKLAQGVKGDVQRGQIQLGLEGKMVELGRALEQFQFDVATDRGEKVVGLGRHRVGGRFLQTGILLQRLVIRLDVPPCALERHHLVGGHGGVAGHQI